MTTLAPHYNYDHLDPRRQSPALHYQPSSFHSVNTLPYSTSSATPQSSIVSDDDHHYDSSSSSAFSLSHQPYSSHCNLSTSRSLPFEYSTTHNLNNLAINVPTSMQPAQHSGSWNFTAVTNGQLTPTTARAPRKSHNHHREASLSSIGSAGPASPYNPSILTPHIVVQDNESSYYDGLSSVDGYHSYSKPLTPHTPNDFLYGYNEYNNTSNLAAFMALRQQEDAESMPAPDYSHARSVASTHDSPSTPSETPLEYKTVPKLDRTMSDVYNDELYSPNFAFTSAPTSKPKSSTVSTPQNDVFTQTLQAANNQHLSAPAQSPLQNSRQLSPFRQGSPLAPTLDSFGTSPPMRLGSAQQLRQQQKAENDARILAQQIKRSSPQTQSEEKTISPKDALLDYHGNDDASEMPLFPAANSPRYRPRPAQPQVQQLKAEPSTDAEDSLSLSQQSFRSMATSRRESSGAYSSSSQATPQQGTFAFAPPAVPNVQLPQQYPFVPQPRREQSNISGISGTTPDFPSTLTSMESSSSDYVPENKPRKPAGALADGGTYTCTYHGCTLRFESPAKLQKHKREGHRQSAPLGQTARETASPEAAGGMTSAVNRNSQAGPHKCERINPSTGKPCNTIFSRPYDLTRHEDTIHNAKKKKTRCPYCVEIKEFSRNDALTRHLRVVHPEIDSKTRRKGHN